MKRFRVFPILAATLLVVAVWLYFPTGDGWEEAGLEANITSLACAPDRMYAGTNDGRVFSWTLNPKTIWVPERGRSTRSVDSDPVAVSVSGMEVFAASFQKGAFQKMVSMDSLYGFSAMNAGLPTPTFVDDYGARCIIAAKRNLFLGTHSGVYWRLNDESSHWGPIGLSGQDVRALAMSRADDKALLAATRDGIYRAKNPTTLSSWYWAAWERVQDGDFITMAPFGYSVWAGSASQGVFHSIDEGKNWWSASYGLPRFGDGYVRVNTIFVHPGTDVVHAGTTVGIFRWDHNKWVPWGLSGHDVRAIAADEAGNVFAGTDEGVYRHPAE